MAPSPAGFFFCFFDPLSESEPEPEPAFEPPLEESSESAINSLLLNPPPAPPPPVLEGAAAPEDFLGLLAAFGFAPPPRKN